MTNNCLFTKLKGDADNDTLDLYGGIRILAHNGNKVIIKVSTGGKVSSANGMFNVLNSAGDQTVASNVYEWDCDGTAYLFAPLQDDTRLIVTDKYANDVMLISCIGSAQKMAEVNFDDANYSKKFDSFACLINIFEPVGTLDFSTIDDLSSCLYFDLEITNPSKMNLIIPNDVKFPSIFYKFRYFRRFQPETVNITCDLSSFEGCTALQEINMMWGSNVTGSVDALCDALYNGGAGKTSGSILFSLQGTGCTFNGEEITEAFTIAFTSEGWSVEEE